LKKAKKDSLKSRFAGCNLVVKNIPKEITEQELFELFKKFGDVSSAKLLFDEGDFKEIRNDAGIIIDKVFTYESKGSGFVLFRNQEDAMKVNIVFQINYFRQKKVYTKKNLNLKEGY
jgi:RNA recognition motif-containing protein